MSRKERWSASQLAAHRNIEAHRKRKQPLIQPSLQLQTIARQLGDILAVSRAAHYDLTRMLANMNRNSINNGDGDKPYDYSATQDEDAKVCIFTYSIV